MKNLFDYATKELSQDAFLRWFFENYDDPEIGPIVVDFINTFTAGQKNPMRTQMQLKPSDIIKIKTFAQLDNIDVSVDIYAKQFGDSHRTIVIEDKTGSKENQQLKEYNKKISTWKEYDKTPEECVYKVFYKTNYLDKDEAGRVDAAKWTAFNIEAIYKFFVGRGNTKSQIFNDYVEHIVKIYNSYSQISKEAAEKWTKVNWETFLRENMAKDFPGVKSYTESYRGLHKSMRVNYYLDKNQIMQCATLELKVGAWTIYPAIHPSFHIGEDWFWSLNEIEDENQRQIAYEEVSGLRKFVEGKSSLIKRANTVRAFAKIKEDIQYREMHADEIWNTLRVWIAEFLRIVKEYDSQIEENK